MANGQLWSRAPVSECSLKMRTVFRIFLRVYLFYMHVGGFVPFSFDFKKLSHRASRGWRGYSFVYGVIFIISQVLLYAGMTYNFLYTWGAVNFRSLRVLTMAVSYLSVLIMTSSIVIHHVVEYRRIFNFTEQIFGIIHQLKVFNLNGSLAAQQLRSRLFWAFVVKAAYFELLSLLLFVDRDGSWISATALADLGLRSNLWLINIMTTLYVGVFLVIIYHFKILNWRVAAISEELRRTQSLKKRRKCLSGATTTTTRVDLSFRYCDDIDEIAVLHQRLRRLARQVQRLFQPLLLLTFIYHWCDFIIQAYLWYITYVELGAFRLLTLLHYLAALLADLVDVIFLCAVVHKTTNVATETGLMLQKFNEFEMDQRLERTVSAVLLPRRGPGGWQWMWRRKGTEEDEDKVMTMRRKD